jgi:hypothetical protein
MTTAELLTRLDVVIGKGRAVLASVDPVQPTKSVYFNPEHRWVKPDLASAFRTSGLSLLRSIYGEEHQTYRDFNIQTDNKNTLESWRKPVAVMETVREEVEGDVPVAVEI